MSVTRQINTFKHFGKYGWSWSTGKPREWGNTTKLAWLAKIIHKLNGDKYWSIKF